MSTFPEPPKITCKLPECTKKFTTPSHFCHVCKGVFYCSRDHRKLDLKRHKKEDCALLIRDLNQSNRQNAEAVEALDKAVKEPQPLVRFANIVDVCCAATRTFTEKYVLEKLGMKSVGSIPLGVRLIDGNKYIFIDTQPGMDIPTSVKAWEDSKTVLKTNDFWAITSMNKSAFYCIAVVCAIRQLEMENGFQFRYEDEEVVSYGAASVFVNREFQKLVPVLEWSKSEDDPSKWQCIRNHLNNDAHNIFWVRLGKTGRRIIIDFCAPQYGIFEYNRHGHPLHIVDEEKQTDYKLRECLYPSEAAKSLVRGLDTQKETNDINPMITAGFKEEILQRVKRYMF